MLVKRSLEDTAFPGEWELPGGGIDFGETIQDSLKREMKEETGLVVQVLQPLTVNNFTIKNSQYFEVTFLCRVTDGSYNIVLSYEHTEYLWILLSKLDSIEISDYIRKTLVDTQKSLSL